MTKRDCVLYFNVHWNCIITENEKKRSEGKFLNDNYYFLVVDLQFYSFTLCILSKSSIINGYGFYNGKKKINESYIL